MPDVQNTLLVLIFANTISVIFALTMIAVMLVRMNVEISKFTDIKITLAELSKVIEQQSRLLEYISRRDNGN
jgi:hypothetical protein